MSHGTAIVADFQRQLDHLAPAIEAAIRRGERVRIKLYSDGETALAPQFMPMKRGVDKSLVDR